MVMWLGNNILEKVSLLFLCTTLYLNQWVNNLTKSLFSCIWIMRLKRFTPKPMISFRSAVEISSYLVRVKLNPEERSKGSFKCGSERCEFCLNLNETSTFTITVTDETFIINHKFNCNDKCLVTLQDGAIETFKEIKKREKNHFA